MKKINYFILLISLVFLLAACINGSGNKNNPQSKGNKLTIFSLNDTHGGVYASPDALSKFGKFYKEFNDTNKMLITNGDMLQGTAYSNVFFGAPIIKTLNYLGCDGFNIGNHEFDWGIDKITRLRDNLIVDDHVELNCPILAANIFYKRTNQPLENTVPYIIKEINGVKIGVIGLIGKIENSIEYTRIKDYYFEDPVTSARKYAKFLRENENCKGVIITIHNGEDINQEFASLIGNEQIDAIFNGHTHQKKYELIDNRLPTIQCRPNDESFFCSLSFEIKTDKIEFIKNSQKHYNVTNMTVEPTCELIRQEYMAKPEFERYNKVITNLTSPIKKSLILNLVVRHIKKEFAGDIAVFNNGGIRIWQLSGTIKGLDIYNALPFDNKIISCQVPGSVFLNFYHNMQGLIYSPFRLEEIEPNKNYKVIGIDYVLNSNYYSNAIKRYHQENPSSLWQVNDTIYREKLIELFATHNPFTYEEVLNTLR